MRPACGQIRGVDKEILTNTRQMGIGRVQFNLPHDLPADGLWKHEDLARSRDVCDRYGIIVEVMENVPTSFHDKAMLGLEGRGGQIENVYEPIRSLGWAGIPVLRYRFSPFFVWGTGNHAPMGRYGATIQAFDLETQKRGVDDTDGSGQRRDATMPDAGLLRENFGYFIKRVIPAAEGYNVIMALHPDDSPVESLSDIARMFVDLDNYKQAEAMIDSPNWGLLFCTGTFSQMEGGTRNIFDTTKYFGPRKRLAYVHMRDARGTVPKLQECFLGGRNFDLFEVVYKLMHFELGKFLASDHVPDVKGDREWGHKVKYVDTAYIKGSVEAIGKMGAVKQVQGNLWTIYCAWIKGGKEG